MHISVIPAQAGIQNPHQQCGIRSQIYPDPDSRRNDGRFDDTTLNGSNPSLVEVSNAACRSIQPVIPAKAGIQNPHNSVVFGPKFIRIPTLAGMTADLTTLPKRAKWFQPVVLVEVSNPSYLSKYPTRRTCRSIQRVIPAQAGIRGLRSSNFLYVRHHPSRHTVIRRYARAAVLWNRSACSVAEKSRANRLKAFQHTV